MSSISTHADGRPFGMGKRSYVKMLDNRGFRNWKQERNQIAETDDDDKGAMSFICAQVVGGASLKAICDHYGIEYGLLYDFVHETTERIERYRAAQSGTAEYYAGEIVEIADALDENGATDYSRDVKRDDLKIKVRRGLMNSWNRPKYGEASQTQINLGANSLVAILSVLPSAQVEADREEKRIAAELIEGEVVAEIPAPKIPEKISEIPAVVPAPVLTEEDYL